MSQLNCAKPILLALGIVLSGSIGLYSGAPALAADDKQVSPDKSAPSAKADSTNQKRAKSTNTSAAPTSSSSQESGTTAQNFASDGAKDPSADVDAILSGAGAGAGSDAGTGTGISSPNSAPSDLNKASGSNASSDVPPTTDSGMNQDQTSSNTDAAGAAGNYAAGNDSSDDNGPLMTPSEYNNRGVAALEAKDFKTAVADFERATQMDPNYKKARENLAVAYYNWGVQIYNNHQYAQAEPLLKKAVQLDQAANGTARAEFSELYKNCVDYLQRAHSGS